MRLIDADKLMPKLWVCYEENKRIVDEEPTVNAIPVEWLEKNAITQLDFGLGIRMLIKKYREEQNAKK